MALNLEDRQRRHRDLRVRPHIKEGDTVKRTGAIVDVPRGQGCWAALLTARQPDRRQGPDQGEASAAWRRQGAGHHPASSRCMSRWQTGLKAIDALIPVGRGQRELIIGDRQTGKTASRSTPSSTRSRSTTGRREKEAVLRLCRCRSEALHRCPVGQELEDNGAMEYSIVVAATASDPAPLQFLAPYAGCTHGRIFPRQWHARPDRL